MQLELKQLQEHLGITFIFVTHDQEEALVMADRIAVMDRGRLIQVGPARRSTATRSPLRRILCRRGEPDRERKERARTRTGTAP